MYNYNDTKIKEAKVALNLSELSDDDFCKTIFKEYYYNNFQEGIFKDKIDYLHEGSDRIGFAIDSTNIVIKISKVIEDYDNQLCLQGAVEHDVWEQAIEREALCEFYGFSENYAVIFCEYLNDELFLCGDFRDYILDLYDCTEEFFINNMEVSCLDIENYFLEAYDCEFNDIHDDNVGVDAKGNLKVLDLGYGNGDTEVNTVKGLKNSPMEVMGYETYNNQAVQSYLSQEVE